MAHWESTGLSYVGPDLNSDTGQKEEWVGLGRQTLATMVLNSSCLTMLGKWLKELGTVLMAQLAEDNRNLVSLIHFTLRNFYLASLVVRNSLIMSTLAFLSW